MYEEDRKPKGLRLWARVLTRVLRLVVWAPFQLYRIRVSGRESVPQQGAVIVACNHLSDIDPGVLWLNLRRPAVAIAMDELWKWPVLRHIVSALGMIRYKRGSGLSGLSARHLSLELLHHQGLLLIFPQGKCVPPGEVGTWHSGVADFALETGAPVVPVGISGSEKFGRYARRFRGGEDQKTIWLRFGEPIQPAGYSADELLERVKKEVMNLAQVP